MFGGLVVDGISQLEALVKEFESFGGIAHFIVERADIGKGSRDAIFDTEVIFNVDRLGKVIQCLRELVLLGIDQGDIIESFGGAGIVVERAE